jgi:putative endonuclease
LTISGSFGGAVFCGEGCGDWQTAVKATAKISDAAAENSLIYSRFINSRLFEMSEFLNLTEKHKRPAAANTSETGSRGERIAAEYLERIGYRIVMANFTAPIGRDIRGTQVKGEIDIIALEGDILCFVEVKTRRSTEFAGPLSNVDLRKQRVVTRTARVYRRVFDIRDIKHRFDVVGVVDSGTGDPEIEIHKGFWSEGKFRKRDWGDDRF